MADMAQWAALLGLTGADGSANLSGLAAAGIQQAQAAQAQATQLQGMQQAASQPFLNILQAQAQAVQAAQVAQAQNIQAAQAAAQAQKQQQMAMLGGKGGSPFPVLPQGKGNGKSGGKARKRSNTGCWFFGKGQCTEGDNCKFSHDTQAVLKALEEGENQTPVCWYWAHGICKNGEACTFKHEGDISQNAKRSRIPEPMDDEIYTAVKVTLSAVVTCESADELVKIQTRIAKYARDSVQDVENRSNPEAMISEYVNSFLGRIFHCYCDREWFPQADWLLLLDATIRRLLPGEVLAQMNPEDLESITFRVHDAVIEENKTMPKVWEAIQQFVQGPKIRKTVNKAIDAARKSAREEVIIGLDEFCERWIAHTGEKLNEMEMLDYLNPDQAVGIFTTVFEAGGYPDNLVQGHQTRAGNWKRFVGEMVGRAWGVDKELMHA